MVRVEEELRDREVGLGELLGACADGRSTDGERGCGSGCAATPIEKSPSGADEPDELDGVVQLARRGARGPAGGSPPRARMFSIPASGYRPTIPSSSARVCAAQVRCAIAVIARLAVDAHDDLVGPLAGRSARAVGDRHERRRQRLELHERPFERCHRLVGARREELERDRRARAARMSLIFATRFASVRDTRAAWPTDSGPTPAPSPSPATRLRGHGYFKRLGPGIVTGAADDDPSGIGTYSQVGAAVRIRAALVHARRRPDGGRGAGDSRPASDSRPGAGSRP